jgi:type IV secretion system protein TrbG
VTLRLLKKIAVCVCLVNVTALYAATSRPATSRSSPVVSPQDVSDSQIRYNDTASVHDGRNVTVTYNRDRIVPLLAHPGEVLHIELSAADGDIERVILGDTERWTLQVVKGPVPRVFVQPRGAQPMSTSGTILTSSGRVYEFRLISAPDGPRYHRVAFRYPDDEMLAFVGAQQRSAQIKRDIESHSAQELSDPRPKSDLNFDYVIEGKGSFRPSAVYDDGMFTMVVMPASVQTMPALFQLVGKDVQLVDYVPLKAPSGATRLQVQRLVEGLLLKLDGEEISIRRADKNVKASWWAR